MISTLAEPKFQDIRSSFCLKAAETDWILVIISCTSDKLILKYSVLKCSRFLCCAWCSWSVLRLCLWNSHQAVTTFRLKMSYTTTSRKSSCCTITVIRRNVTPPVKPTDLQRYSAHSARKPTVASAEAGDSEDISMIFSQNKNLTFKLYKANLNLMKINLTMC